MVWKTFLKNLIYQMIKIFDNFSEKRIFHEFRCPGNFCPDVQNPSERLCTAHTGVERDFSQTYKLKSGTPSEGWQTPQMRFHIF